MPCLWALWICLPIAGSDRLSFPPRGHLPKTRIRCPSFQPCYTIWSIHQLKFRLRQPLPSLLSQTSPEFWILLTCPHQWGQWVQRFHQPWCWRKRPWLFSVHLYFLKGEHSWLHSHWCFLWGLRIDHLINCFDPHLYLHFFNRKLVWIGEN